MAGPEGPIEIDAAELEEAQRDPLVRAFVDEAEAYGARIMQEGRDRTGIGSQEVPESPFAHAAREALQAAQTEREQARENNDLVEVLEVTEGTAVLRSPATGKLYGISLDIGPEGEHVEVTELEELSSEEQR